MDTRMIEVGIGLVLVFAISSLVVTTLHEIWISARGSRGDNLLIGFCSILGDNQVTVGQMRRRMLARYQPSVFTKALLAHPLLVSHVLGSKADQRNPSYLAPEVFVTALIAQISEMYNSNQRPDTPQEWVNAAVAGNGAYPAGADNSPTDDLLKTLGVLAQGVSADWPAFERRLCAWYEGVMDRASGWFRRDTQLRLGLIGLAVAALMNINPLVIAPRLWNDPVLRSTVADVANQAGQAYAAANAMAASAPFAASAATPADTAASASRRSAQAAANKPKTAPAQAAEVSRVPQSLEADQALLALKEAMFAAAATARVHPTNGAAQEVERALADLLDLADHVQLRRLLSQRADGFPDTVFEASVIIETHLATLITAVKREGQGSGHTATTQRIDRLQRALLAERKALLPLHAGQTVPRGRIEPASSQRACVEAEDAGTQALCQQVGALQSLAGIGLPIGWDWDNWPLCDAACQARHRVPRTGPLAPAADWDTYAKALQAHAPAQAASTLQALYRDNLSRHARAAVDNTNSMTDELLSLWRDADVLRGIGRSLIGWLLMAVASTLGAPFWFDLLGRLTKLRGAGTGATKDAAKSGNDAANASVLATPPQATPPGSTSPSPAGGSTPSAAAGGDTGAITPAERELDSVQIVRLQAALGLTGLEASGRFDAATRTRIVQWQQAQQAAATGELDATQISTLLSPAAPVALASLPLTAGRSALPRRTDGRVTVLSEAEVRAAYGDIDTDPDPAQPGFVRIRSKGVQGKPQHSIVPFNHPLLVGKGGPQQVHALALKHFQAVFAAIDAQGLGMRILHCNGTFVARHIDRDISRPLSRHSWGIAIDINGDQNGFNQKPAPLGTTGSVLELVPIFEAHGFAWGGLFSRAADGMHFELALRDPAA